jgi:hypothetical protein
LCDDREAAASFAVLVGPTRPKLLWPISQSEHDVTTLTELARTSPTTARQHLAKLRTGCWLAKADRFAVAASGLRTSG